METCNSGEFFAKKVVFITGMPFFLLLPPENVFIQKFWTINGHKNEEFTTKHWKKFYVKFAVGFLAFSVSISPGTMVIWT